MSHVADVEMHVTDLDALAKACRELGLELVRDQRTYRWYNRFLNDWHDKTRAAALRGHDPKTFGHCLHAIRIPGNAGAYEVGVVQALNGKGFDLIYDAYCGGMGLENITGVGLRKLRDEYAAQVAIKQVQRQGYKVTRRVNAKGDIELVALKA